MDKIDKMFITILIIILSVGMGILFISRNSQHIQIVELQKQVIKLTQDIEGKK